MSWTSDINWHKPPKREKNCVIWIISHDNQIINSSVWDDSWNFISQKSTKSVWNDTFSMFVCPARLGNQKTIAGTIRQNEGFFLIIAVLGEFSYHDIHFASPIFFSPYLGKQKLSDASSRYEKLARSLIIRAWFNNLLKNLLIMCTLTFPTKKYADDLLKWLLRWFISHVKSNNQWYCWRNVRLK